MKITVKAKVTDDSSYFTICRGTIKTVKMQFNFICVQQQQYYPVGVLGIDLGIKNIAVDSDKEIFESKRIENREY